MGESGAGKTTLLNVLAQRANFGVVTGDMFINGQSLPRDFRSQTYVLAASVKENANSK
jgi:ATP-binding cassette subfamily G (WHITE) protein 2 (SNQ2)